MSQNLEALNKANEVRLYRLEIKRGLSEGRLKFRDIDLSDPRLASMRVEQMLRALPWKTEPRTTHKYINSGAKRRPLVVLQATEMSALTTFGSLSAARKQQLKDCVDEICPSQRVK